MDIESKFYISNRYAVSELINSIPINEVLERYFNVQLRKSYNNKISIPCPIHKGRNKNFTVYLDSNMATCFSKCGGKTYNIISLAYEVFGKDFDYAMIKIALDFNIDISKYLRVKG